MSKLLKLPPMDNRELADACFEILEWHKTCVLRDGIVRRIAFQFYQDKDIGPDLNLVETMILTETARRWVDVIGTSLELRDGDG